MKEFTRRGLIFGAANAAASGALVGVERLCLSVFAGYEEPEEDPGPVKIVKFSGDGTLLGTFILPKARKGANAAGCPLKVHGAGKEPNLR